MIAMPVAPIQILLRILLLQTSLTTVSSLSLKTTSRRQWLRAACGVATVATSPLGTRDACAIDELPAFVRPFTALAPLGAPAASSKKTFNLALEDLSARLSHDLTEGATDRGGYFLTGDLSTDLFRDDCSFVDPTNSVSSLSRYQNALRILFDPSQSKVTLVTPLVVDETSRTISGTIRSRGVLQLPWHPRISTYESSIVYTIDDDGLVREQRQTWSKSASEALRESFTPGFLPPPPQSTLLPSAVEPPEVTKLFDMINGRRPAEYTLNERIEIASLVDAVVNNRYPWKRELLPGTWLLAYLQPGPDGGGVDRRVPFPELPFNDSYQIFTRDGVTNVGELVGPLLKVRVSGTLREENLLSLEVPKRFVASINEGRLCAKDDVNCLPLPISGEGLFDGVYLGERLRIGQNVNGGGARAVQVRIS